MFCIFLNSGTLIVIIFLRGTASYVAVGFPYSPGWWSMCKLKTIQNSSDVRRLIHGRPSSLVTPEYMLGLKSLVLNTLRLRVNDEKAKIDAGRVDANLILK